MGVPFTLDSAATGVVFPYIYLSSARDSPAGPLTSKQRHQCPWPSPAAASCRRPVAPADVECEV
eukprot:1146920-Pelagomonas_calceolata.AAC.5